MSFVSTEIVKQRCNVCSGRFDLEAGFRRRGLEISSPHATCMLCEQTERDKKKNADRWTVKARDTVRRHAHHYKLTAREFTIRLVGTLNGWHISLSTLTAKRVNIAVSFIRSCRAGFNRSRWTSSTGSSRRIWRQTRSRAARHVNRKKSKWPPDRWARHLRYAAEWEARQEVIRETLAICCNNLALILLSMDQGAKCS